ncbi:hypothetical protein LZ30DRAFT_685677 [Colletotrichum cereale]|nr:hypothetical protein LZ30DRAFT_685677 [Colletotrichum cereale]
MPLTQWFDIWSVENSGERPEIQEAGLRQSASFITKVSLMSHNWGWVISTVSQVVPSPVLATHGRLDKEPLSASKSENADGIETTPVFLAHAVDDQVVSVQNGRVLRDALRNENRANVEWHEYEHGGHWTTEPA